MMRVATDIGGTFTDVVTLDGGRLRGRKVPSTPQHPDHAVVDVIGAIGPISSFSHGTTVATNAVLERKGAQTALITTAGFKDLLYIARQQRPRLYDFDCTRPQPVIARDLCFEAAERIGHDGFVITPLAQVDVARLADAVVNAGAESVAVCLLFSYKNPSHEIRLEQEFKKRGLPVSISAKIVPEYREFERASTTAVNAYVEPLVRCYLEKIRNHLRVSGQYTDYYVMKSSGGVATTRETYPAELILSGPAGGVSGALLLGNHMAAQNVITFDMGGTSADFSAIYNGVPARTEEGDIDGLPIQLSTLDITTVGAGGGSIAWLDKGGALRVGPKSAGAEPGPACYDRSGTQPTVTDANLLSGLLAPQSFAVSQIRLNPEKAAAALQRLTSQSGLSLDAAIMGIRAVVNANMLRGIRRATVEKGIDTRACVLMAFGGAGPLHAAELASELGITEVIIPPMAGMFSALGILLSNARLVFGKSLLIPFDAAAQTTIEEVLATFTRQARRSFERQGLKTSKTTFYPSVDLRYQGQSFHLPIAYDRQVDMMARFHETFKDRYGYRLSDMPVEIVSVRLSALAERQPFTLPTMVTGGTACPSGTREILLSCGRRTAIVYQRRDLPHGFEAPGPVIVEDEGCTVWVPPDTTLSVETNDCLRISLESPVSDQKMTNE